MIEEDEPLDTVFNYVRPGDGEYDPRWTLSPVHPSRRHPFPVEALRGHVTRVDEGAGAAFVATLGLAIAVGWFVWCVGRWVWTAA